VRQLNPAPVAKVRLIGVEEIKLEAVQIRFRLTRRLNRRDRVIVEQSGVVLQECIQNATCCRRF
jgi:hypothetical protein